MQISALGNICLGQSPYRQTHKTKEQYFPRGQTAFYDAVGNTLNYFMEKKITDTNAYKCCSIYLVTDGLENISKNYNSNNLKLMIENAEKYYNIKLFYLKI